MTIQFECECGETLEVGEEFAGKRGRCPSCKAIVRVPEMAPEPLELKESAERAPEEGEAAQEIGTGLPGGADQGRGQPEESPDEGPAPYATAAFSGRWRRALLLALPAVAIAGVSLYLVMDSGSRRSEPMGPRQGVSTMAAKETGPKVSVVVETPVPLASETQAVPPAGPPAGENKGVSAEVASQGVGEAPDVTKGAPKEVASRGAEGRSSERVAKGLGKPAVDGGRYTVRVGSFREQQRADRLASDLKKKGLDAFVWTAQVSEKGKWHRVGVGRFEIRKEAELYAKGLKERLRLETVVTDLPSGGR